MQTQSRLFNYFAALSISVKISSFSRQSSDSSVFKSLKKGILWFIQYTLIIKTNYIKCDVNLQYSFIISSLFISVVVGIWKLSHDCNYCRSQITTLSEAWCDFNLLSRYTFVLLPIKAVFTELTEPINLLVCLLHWFSCSAFLSKAVCFVLPTESHSCCIGDLANYEEYLS